MFMSHFEMTGFGRSGAGGEKFTKDDSSLIFHLLPAWNFSVYVAAEKKKSYYRYLNALFYFKIILNSKVVKHTGIV